MSSVRASLLSKLLDAVENLSQDELEAVLRKAVDTLPPARVAAVLKAAKKAEPNRPAKKKGDLCINFHPSLGCPLLCGGLAGRDYQEHGFCSEVA